MNQPITIDGWTAKLYDVKRVKAVYLFDGSYVAQGYFILVFVEFTNNSGGTAYPGQLRWYLVDQGGKRYETSSAQASGYAGWQFQTGSAYENFNPGQVLGVVVAWDLPPDVAGLYLRFHKAPTVAFDLGNFSQLPETK
jgi:hypothetical protein